MLNESLEGEFSLTRHLGIYSCPHKSEPSRVVMLAMSLMDTEKRVCPRIEPCGTPIETARGLDNSPSDLTH
jgi:hypothetical protein